MKTILQPILNKFIFAQVAIVLFIVATNVNEPIQHVVHVPIRMDDIDNFTKASKSYVIDHSIPTEADDEPMMIPKIEFSEEDRVCLANNIYFEGRSESTAGQIAIGAVTIKRVIDRAFPNTICGVVKQTRRKLPNGLSVLHKCQFSWYCDGKPDTPTEKQAYIKAQLIADMLLSKDSLIIDPTNGADHYHADYVAPPVWTQKMVEVAKIDTHVFYTSPLKK